MWWILSWWRHQMETFSASLALCSGNSPVTGESPSQRPVTRSFDVFLICAWINGWVNNHEAGDLRRHRAHYDVTVMIFIEEQLRIHSFGFKSYITYSYLTPTSLQIRNLLIDDSCEILPSNYIYCAMNELNEYSEESVMVHFRMALSHFLEVGWKVSG